VALGAIVGLLAACGNNNQANQTKGLIKQLGSLVTGEGAAPPTPTADQIRAAVTPEVRAQQFGNQPLMIAGSMNKPVTSILVLASRNGNVDTYFTPDSISLSLRDGILVASRGLGSDLMRADVSQVMPRIQEGAGVAMRQHTYLNGENQEVVSRFTCSYAEVEAEVVESCRGADTSFENRYVLNDDGQIAVSIQFVSPQLGSFRLEDLG